MGHFFLNYFRLRQPPKIKRFFNESTFSINITHDSGAEHAMGMA